MYRSPIKNWQEQFMKPKGGRAMFSDWSYVTVTPDEPIRPGPAPNVNYSLYEDYLDRVSHGNEGRYIPQRHKKHRHKTGGITADDNTDSQPNDSHDDSDSIDEPPKTSLLVDGFDKTSEELMKPVDEDDSNNNDGNNNDDSNKTEEEDKKDDSNNNDGNNQQGQTSGLYPNESDDDYYYYTYSDSEIEN